MTIAWVVIHNSIIQTVELPASVTLQHLVNFKKHLVLLEIEIYAIVVEQKGEKHATDNKVREIRN